MLAWATVNVTVNGAASRPPDAPRIPSAPAGTVIVSVVVGTNGAAATKVKVLPPARRHVPATGGLNMGRPVALATGADRVTVTVWSDGTSVAPAAGTVDITASWRTGAVDEVLGVPDGCPEDVEWLLRPSRKAPEAIATTATTRTTTHAVRCRRGGGFRISYSTRPPGCSTVGDGPGIPPTPRTVRSERTDRTGRPDGGTPGSATRAVDADYRTGMTAVTTCSSMASIRTV